MSEERIITLSGDKRDLIEGELIGNKNIARYCFKCKIITSHCIMGNRQECEECGCVNYLYCRETDENEPIKFLITSQEIERIRRFDEAILQQTFHEFMSNEIYKKNEEKDKIFNQKMKCNIIPHKNKKGELG